MSAAWAALGFYLHFLPYYFAGPPPSARCGEGPGLRYCRYEAPYGVREDPGAVLYFLHYGSGDERSWRRLPVSRVYYEEFRRRGLAAPKVVSVSYGPYWRFVAARGGRIPSPSVGDFASKALPWLEREGAPKRRYLWGMSQGGLSAATLVFARPELWRAAVLSCPALYALDAFAPDAQVAMFAADHHLDPAKLRWGLALISERSAGPGDWRREDPLRLAAGPAKAGLPPLFLESNLEDGFGFALGARDFAAALRRRGRSVAFRESPGQHCEIDPWAATDFLAAQQEKR